MSGYTEDEAVRRGALTGHVRFLQKPFDIATLAREIRAALGVPGVPPVPVWGGGGWPPPAYTEQKVTGETEVGASANDDNGRSSAA